MKPVKIDINLSTEILSQAGQRFYVKISNGNISVIEDMNWVTVFSMKESLFYEIVDAVASIKLSDKEIRGALDEHQAKKRT